MIRILPLGSENNKSQGGEKVKKYRVAVETGLSNIEETLKDEGYDVVDADEFGSNVDAFVITGLDEDLMGISSTLTDGIVIDASGRDPEEVVYELERNLRKREKKER
jgi:hypothetical protein